MTSLKSRLLPAFLLGLLAFSVTTVISAQDQPADPGSRVRDLLIEKRDVLVTKLAHAKMLELQGTLPTGTVLDVELDLLGAKLALAESAADRVSILEARLKNRRSKESLMDERFGIGEANVIEKLDATVQRIDAAIALERMVNDR